MNVKKSNIANLPTKHGKFKIIAYKDSQNEHLAIFTENIKEIKTPYVRVHSECLTGDVVGSLKCDCQNQLNLALDFIGEHGGMVIYHRQEGRNIGLFNKVNAYALQDQGRDTIQANEDLGFKADQRDYSIVGYILKDFGIKKLKLLTNNPEKIKYLESQNIEIVERIPSITEVNKFNEKYLNTKRKFMGHII